VEAAVHVEDADAEALHVDDATLSRRELGTPADDVASHGAAA
jgi:hypothetical protein